MLEIAFRSDADAPAPLYQQLAGYLAELIATGRIGPGERLPATRDLARALGLSRNTVSRAYESLAGLGVLSAHVGQGTFVAARALPRFPGRDEPPARELAWSGLLSRSARRLRAPGAPLEPEFEPRYDFRPGRVDPETLPLPALQRAYLRALGHHLGAHANRMDPLGFEPLRARIAEHLVQRGIRCGADDVMVVAGAQQVLDLVARALLDPGDIVALEQPGYFGAMLAFQACGARLVGVRVDAHGARTDELARLVRRARPKLVYVTPAVQMPTGVAMSEPRRETLLELADREQIPILEDDYDAELRIEPPLLPALKTLDRAGLVIYAGTFSKALFPGLRMGYVVAAPRFLQTLSLLRLASCLQPPLVEQAALAELLAGDALARHVRRVRRLYARRLQVLEQALGAALGERARWSSPVGGNSLWLELPSSVDPDALAEASRERGVACVPGELFHLQRAPRPALCLSVATLAEAEIPEAVTRLADAIHHAERPGSVRSNRSRR